MWIRVDENRLKLAVFVALFVTGSAVLLAVALVGVPGALIGGALVLEESAEATVFFGRLLFVVAATILVLLALGSLLAAVQLSNAEDWVRNRFSGREPQPGEHPDLERVVSDMAVASGLPQAPRLLVLDTPNVNACAIGMNRSGPVIGVTRGFLGVMSPEEQRAVVATLIARIVAGDILFGTALAALMGPLKAIRQVHKGVAAVGDVAGGCALDGCADGCSGCGDLPGCLFDAAGDEDSGAGCLAAAGVVLFGMFVAAMTYVAVVSAAWIVTAWGRALNRTSYEKADAEGMLLLKDPGPMLSALGKAIGSSTKIGDGDLSYDGIFYASTSGTPAVEKVERRRYERLREVLGTDGLAAPLD